ncbi:MAG: VanW family protein [Actinomycetota bacterium]|nr:VanW family protein [Actinomycetota bacterium]
MGVRKSDIEERERKNVADEESTHNDRKGVYLALGGVAVLVGGLYAAGVYFLGDRVPSGTQVAGVAIGGLDPQAAERRLSEGFAERAAGPIEVSYEGETWRIRPRRAGLHLDVEQTVAEAGGERTWSPIRMVEIIVGSGDAEPVIDVDGRALRDAIDKIARQVDVAPVEPSVTFAASGRREIENPVVGRRVDTAETAALVRDAFVTGDGPVDLPVVEREPSVNGDDFAAALDTLVRPAVVGPVTLVLPQRRAKLLVAEFAPALSMQVVDGALTPMIDSGRLEDGLTRLRERIDSAPQDATVVLRDGRPQIVPAEPGIRIVSATVADALGPVLSKSGTARRVQVGTKVEQPEFTTKNARDLGITETVSDFVTYFPHAEYRNINQGRAAELINGTLLEADDVFSFNETVGERTRGNGFVPGFVISDGVFAEDLGGGVSQVVTTTYNAAFFAGLEDVEHQPHSFYIDRYPLGREATVAWPVIDMKFANNTPYGVLIQAWVVPSTRSSEGEMHVRMWSTEYWDIKAGVSERYAFTSPKTRYDPSDECVATTGYGGFGVDVYRYVRRAGHKRLLRTETDTVTYTPADTVVCTAPPR